VAPRFFDFPLEGFNNVHRRGLTDAVLMLGVHFFHAAGSERAP